MGSALCLDPDTVKIPEVQTIPLGKFILQRPNTGSRGTPKRASLQL